MGDDDKAAEQAKGGNRSARPESALSKCGIIMPISATSAHSEGHWLAVKELLSRAIVSAGHEPAPVWENTSRDRVSERIIGNIFNYSIVVADISDLNPNVMLELGLRLASMKPTVVVVDDAGEIPFDIRDFHALKYPSSLSMLGMERFMSELAEAIREKAQAAKEDDYTPFLGKIVVDVVSPDERQVPLNQYVIDRLEELSARVSKLSSRDSRSAASATESRRNSEDLRITADGLNYSEIYFSTRETLSAADEDRIAKAFPGSDVYSLLNSMGASYYSLRFSTHRSPEKMHYIIGKLTEVLRGLDGSIGIPERIASYIDLE